MTRVVKKPDIRKMEIISAAERLFEENGYEKTSVESIIKSAGIAKGTFYYYFKAKKDILQALVEKTGIEMAAYFNSVLEMKNVTAIDKLKLMLRGPEKKAIIESPIMSAIHKPENRELQEELNIQSIKIIAPLIAKVLQQGYKEGVFKKPASVESIQLILAGSQFILDSGLFEWSSKERSVFLKSIQILLEKLVETKPGVFNFISDEQ